MSNFDILPFPPEREVVVDAGYLASGRHIIYGLVEVDVTSVDHQVVSGDVEERWIIRPDEDPQLFKNRLLKENFTTAELEFREVVIEAISQKTREAWEKSMVCSIDIWIHTKED